MYIFNKYKTVIIATLIVVAFVGAIITKNFYRIFFIGFVNGAAIVFLANYFKRKKDKKIADAIN